MSYIKKTIILLTCFKHGLVLNTGIFPYKNVWRHVVNFEIVKAPDLSSGGGGHGGLFSVATIKQPGDPAGSAKVFLKALVE